ncbi:MAG TPA: hypothetical protein DDY70_01250 [Clostridiales bacterium]|nr:hypothetical protein [Clostridiales bacterium]
MQRTDRAAFGISDFYEAVGGDLDEVIDRLEDLDMVKENLLDFSEDTAYAELTENLRKNDSKDAFRAAHTLKGICYTFGIGRLGDSAAAICEELRRGAFPTGEMTERLTKEYDLVIRAIGRLRDGR